MKKFLAIVAAAITIAAGVTVANATIPASADSGITTTDDVNLRAGPGTDHDILGVVPAGTPRLTCAGAPARTSTV